MLALQQRRRQTRLLPGKWRTLGTARTIHEASGARSAFRLLPEAQAPPPPLESLEGHASRTTYFMRDPKGAGETEDPSAEAHRSRFRARFFGR
ncbi:hypothetical protein lerEdw1_008990 [Lerista edwardsae]|nr:hypothetical protein lerEdw1_008990 [Lerista edwardsae]